MRKRSSTDDAELFALFQTLCIDTNTRLREVVLSYLSSTSVTFWSLSDGIVAALSDAHAQSAWLGRRLAGKPGPFDTADQLFASSVMAEQAAYLQRLLQELQAGKYGASGQTDEIAALLAVRLGMYAKRLRGTANQAWVLNLPDGAMVNWTLHPAEHCPDCVERAAGSPYDAQTIPWVPSDGSSRCNVNCACSLEMVGGSGRGFPPVEL